jgi:hypothetical protein
MLTREGFVATDMSAPTVLQRSSWKAEAIRKGNLKISGPIPIMKKRNSQRRVHCRAPASPPSRRTSSTRWMQGRRHHPRPNFLYRAFH